MCLDYSLLRGKEKDLKVILTLLTKERELSAVYLTR